MRSTEILWRKRDCRALSKSERGPASRPPPGQAFIVSLGTLHQGWSLFTMHRFVLGGWLPFTENKGEDVAKYIKEEGYLQM